MNFWYWHKHDFYAASLTLAAIAVFFSVTGTASYQSPPGGSPSLGVWNVEPTASDKWATAGEETTKASSTTPQQASKTDTASAVQSLTPIPLPQDDDVSLRQAADTTLADDAVGDTVETEKLAQDQTGPAETGVPPAHKDAAPSRADHRPPTANVVEAAPRPVEEMSEAEVQAAVKDYERWLHRGQITVLLDYALLNGPQIDTIAGVYVLQTNGTRTEGTRLAITSNGLRTSISDEALEKVLIGDLTPDRHRWPPCLLAKVSWFGPNAAVTAKMVLNDACALKLYRVLAEQAGTVRPPPGTVCRVQLIPANEQIDVRLVNFTQPKESRL